MCKCPDLRDSPGGLRTEGGPVSQGLSGCGRPGGCGWLIPWGLAILNSEDLGPYPKQGQWELIKAFRQNKDMITFMFFKKTQH